MCLHTQLQDCKSSTSDCCRQKCSIIGRLKPVGVEMREIAYAAAKDSKRKISMQHTFVGALHDAVKILSFIKLPKDDDNNGTLELA